MNLSCGIHEKDKTNGTVQNEKQKFDMKGHTTVGSA